MTSINSIKYSGVGKPHIVSPNLGIYHFKGSPREVGFQYGSAFSKDLVKFNGFLKNLLEQSSGKLLSKAVYYAALPFYSAAQWLKIPSSVREEIKGMADGAVDLSRFKAIRYLKMMRLSSLYDFLVNFALAGVGCSSFAKKDDHTGLMIGRNFDLNYDPSGTLERSNVIFYEIDGRQPFISVGPVFFNAAPTTAIIRGENEEPLFFAIHNVIGPKEFFGKPTVALLREMGNQKNYDEIVKLLNRSEETCAKKFIIADGNRAAVADVIPGKGVCLEEIGEKKYIALTNNYQTLRSKKFESGQESEHGLNFNSRVRRYSLIKSIENNSPWLGIVHAVETLSNTYDHTCMTEHPWGDIVSPPFNNDERPPYAANINRTYYSVILDYRKNIFWAAASEYAPQDDFYGFELKNFWKWTAGREELSLIRYPQNPDHQGLKLGRRLTEMLCIGKENYKKGDLNSASDYFLQVLKIDQDNILAQLFLGAATLGLYSARPHHYLNYLNFAESYFENIIGLEDIAYVPPELRRGSAFAHLLLGICFDIQGRREKAIKSYENAINYERSNEFGAEAAGMARKFILKQAEEVPSHKELVKLLL
ncbi:MAG: C45 family autoproteolytic acyltransferase/hydrolase [Candidatus Saganbacteria bacterium]|nr:C45 family autoproteolytic acyltransferase/hydrolase [Candidatus Saganbacteria bacterium]